MTCPQLDEIIQHVDGELALNRYRELQAHFGGCGTCAAQREHVERMVGRMQPDEGEHDDPELVQQVMARVRAGDVAVARPRWRRRLHVALPVAAAAAAALTLAVVLWPRFVAPPSRGGSSAFIARGAPDNNPERWITLWVFQRSSARNKYVEVKRPIVANARLAFGYRNADASRMAGRPYRYLMIFAVDAGKRVYWYYPAYERKGTNPESIALRVGRHRLADEVQHDFKAGALRVFAVFSRRPLRVLAVEKTIARALREPGDGASQLRRLPIADTGQLTRLLEVTPSSP